MELANAVDKGQETTFDIRHTAPQHRQYLEYAVCIHLLTAAAVATILISFNQHYYFFAFSALTL